MSTIQHIQNSTTLDSTTIHEIHVSQLMQSAEALRDLQSSSQEGSKRGNVVTPKKLRQQTEFLAGFVELMTTLNQSNVDAARTGQAMQTALMQNTQKGNENLIKETAKNQELAQQSAKDAKKNSILNGVLNSLMWIGTIVMAGAQAATGNFIGAGLTVGIAVAAYIATSVPVKDGKTPLDLLAECKGMDKLSATLVIDSLVMVLSVGAGAAQAFAKQAVQTAVQTATKEAVEQGTKEAVSSVGSSFAKAGMQSAARETEIEMVEMSTKSAARNGSQEAVATTTQTLTTTIGDTVETTVTTAGKQAAKESETLAARKVAAELAKELAQEEAQEGTKKVLSRVALEESKAALQEGTEALEQLMKKGVISGLKFGATQNMTYFNPFGEIAAKIEYQSKVRDDMTPEEKDDLQTDCELHGSYVAAATSFAYGLASCKFNNMSGIDFFAGNAPKNTVLLQKVLFGVQALIDGGRLVCSGLLASYLTKTADLTKEMGDAQAHIAHLQYAGETVLDAQKRVQNDTSQTIDTLNGLLIGFSQSTAKAFITNA